MNTGSQLSTYQGQPDNQFGAVDLALRTAVARLRERDRDLAQQRWAWPQATGLHAGSAQWAADQLTASVLDIRSRAHDPGVLYWIDRVLGVSQSRTFDLATLQALYQEFRSAVDWV